MASYDIIKAAYATTAVRRDQYPEGNVPEVAFLGRSNVGKSSLINSLCNHRGLARVSGAPGKTQTINYFSAALRRRDEEEGEQRLPFYLVDLPGYGFAKTGGRNRDMWSAFIGEYVTQSPNLCVLCLLVDLRHPGLAIDQQAYDWLASAGVPLQIVGTKADKLKANEKNRNLALLNKLFPSDRPALAYSSLKRDGFGPLAKNLFERVLQFNRL
ncbi:ribosome biogenesis GTP-binding protein YihA/YsxC [uncultured Megasphaera sp.]|uniref:ribosome biogenesis GTP-binding protein YihA/YsxC n=1 Tax=uncultured Megasphaera sp. TaxID=165188 RepID=UPI00262A3109|nr:ribosome biogenesis GTP-binding protein YihA/YsxC [uncultured Megasphaera sp.]